MINQTTGTNTSDPLGRSGGRGTWCPTIVTPGTRARIAPSIRAAKPAYPVPMLRLHWQAIPGILHPNCCEKNKFGGSILGGECMADATEELLSAFDGHDVEGVRAALDAGADPCSPIRGKLPVLWLLEEYTRSDRLGDCLRLLFERGAELPDPSLTPVLLNDAPAVTAAIQNQPAKLEAKLEVVIHRFDMAGVQAAILQSPDDFGLTNVTDPACPGCGIGIPEPDAIDTLVPNPDEYLMWDFLHWTRVVHAIVGEVAANIVQL